MVVSAASSATTPVGWSPHSPFSRLQLQQLCKNPENRNLSRPPEPAGYCDIEVRLTQSQFVTGQGVSEGKGELSFSAYASTFGANPTTVAVSQPTSTYSVGQSDGHSLDLGTYRVKVGDSKDVQICVYFTEHDSGGLNGHDDTGFVCETVTLSCSGGDANGDGQRDGQPSFSTTLGPAPLCGSKPVCGPNQSLGSASATIEVMAADADMDNVPNDQDFTPELCDEVLKGTQGNAALVYYHYGDPGMRGFWQALGLDYAAVFSHYSYVVLVADNDSSNPLGANAQLFAQANKTFPPTREGLIAAMRDLTSQGKRFDADVFAHGYKGGPEDATIEVLSGKQISGDWLISATDPNVIGTARGGIPLMAWWSTTCIAARQIDAWITIGGLAASGAVDVQFYPNAWGQYLGNWVSGQGYKTAVDTSTTALVVAAAEFEVRQEGTAAPWNCVTDDPSTPEPLDGPGVVTDKNACAEDFFNDNLGPHDAKYNIQEVYDRNVSGAANMAIASTRTFLGNMKLTFGAAGKTWP
ncbi:hypothetical protein [Microvirga massiliensis]|uniref:hypothetical protein n=1 Tax=Microvirga massiliensis TaxID=1033741 RepID=UPI00062B7F48|nr:hypothetical protein [Microvirga massiliensis]